MKIVEAYLERARECRQLAGHMPTTEQRDQMLRTARQWEALAEERARTVNPATKPPEVPLH